MINFRYKFHLPNLNIFYWIFIISIAASIAEYCLIYSVRKTSAFIFTSTLALITPITFLLEMISKQLFNTQTKLEWQWYYIVSVLVIVIGCILCHWSTNNSKIEQTTSDEKNSTLEIAEMKCPTQQHNSEL